MLAAILREWDWPRRAGLKEAVDEVIGYLERDAAPDGVSGLLGQRLAHRSRRGGDRLQDGGGRASQLAGMRWGEDGAHAVCHLRGSTAARKDSGRPSGDAILPQLIVCTTN